MRYQSNEKHEKVRHVALPSVESIGICMNQWNSDRTWRRLANICPKLLNKGPGTSTVIGYRCFLPDLLCVRKTRALLGLLGCLLATLSSCLHSFPGLSPTLFALLLPAFWWAGTKDFGSHPLFSPVSNLVCLLAHVFHFYLTSVVWLLRLFTDTRIWHPNKTAMASPCLKYPRSQDSKLFGGVTQSDASTFKRWDLTSYIANEHGRYW